MPARNRSAQGTGSHLEKGNVGRRRDRMGPSGDNMNLPVIDKLEARSDAPQSGPLIDTFGRVHNNLRISVTDRCNLRCTYCMPEDVAFMDRRELLSFEEITRFVEIAAPLGINKVRLTGGEPLLRRDLHRLVAIIC